MGSFSCFKDNYIVPSHYLRKKYFIPRQLCLAVPLKKDITSIYYIIKKKFNSTCFIILLTKKKIIFCLVKGAHRKSRIIIRLVFLLIYKKKMSMLVNFQRGTATFKGYLSFIFLILKKNFFFLCLSMLRP
jgi:hypothetical protein